MTKMPVPGKTTGFAITATVVLALLLLFSILPCRAGDSSEMETLQHLKHLSIEQLDTLEVTSVSKKPEKLSDAAAAVFVITSEDIKRGGFVSIAEALRMVPGLEVAHIDANKWAISSRGFNSWFANKLLVLMDGRSVYTPLFSGVYWDVQDTFLEDIDRIEVIRGPGATLWGANAVNGVINIITKKAHDTQGGVMTAGGGNLEQGFGAVRYGGKIADNAWYRCYAKYFNRGDFRDHHGGSASDDWDQGRTGFRIDWDRSDDDALTFQGDAYTGKSGITYYLTGFVPPEVYDDRANLSGGNLLVRWNHSVSDLSSIALQLYYDRTVRNMELFSEDRDTVDLDFQHSFQMGNRHQVVWGAGYRLSHDHVKNSRTLIFDPEKRTDNLFSFFIQDEISFIDNSLQLTLGSKFEHNDYSGFEIQPSARIRWNPVENHTLWMAVSRAVRTPSRADSDMTVEVNAFKTGPTFNVMEFRGSHSFDPEEVIAYEAGYRFIPDSTLSFDAACFYNVYHDLRGLHIGDPDPPFLYLPPPDKRLIPATIDNRFHEDTYGVELSAKLQVTRWWELSAAYTWIKIHLFADKIENTRNLELAEGGVPRNQFSIRSLLDMPYGLQLDTFLFYVEELSDFDTPGYTRLDIRLGWKPIKYLDLSLKVENLLDNLHPEYPSIEGIQATEVPRSFYGKVTWYF